MNMNDTRWLNLLAPAIAIFGAAGDLTKRLLIPALYNLAASSFSVKSLQSDLLVPR